MKNGIKNIRNVCTKAAQAQVSFTEEIMRNEKDKLPEITFSYMLQSVGEEIVDAILECELSMQEKTSILEGFNKERKIEVLKKLGFKKQLLEIK
jgi:ribosomal protein L21